MKKLEKRHVFTSESVSEGHPDKVADRISDAILDACLKKDPNARVACETVVGPNLVVNVGEITESVLKKVRPEEIVRRVVKEIGYDRPEEQFSFDTLRYENYLHGQSPDISRGVDRKVKEKLGAGDQGMMFGYATRETPAFMPAPIVYSHNLLKALAAKRHSGEISWLRPDAKSQISVIYENGAPVAIDTVVLSHQTTKEGATRQNYRLLADFARDFLSSTGLVTGATKFMVNPTGKFVIGGPNGDSGLTGRKIIVDTYGGMAAHGGGAFSGKDPSKVDRSAAYYARYAAKNIVAAGLADRCEIQVAYAIGVDKPVSFRVRTFGTAKVADDSSLEEMLYKGKVFDFTPYGIGQALGLTKPYRNWRYEDTTCYGHFGRDIFPWEKVDKVTELRTIFK